MGNLQIESGEYTDIGYEPQELHDVRSPVDLTDLRLTQLHLLRGGHPTKFNDQCVMDDVMKKDYVQAIAVGHIPNFRNLMTGKGPKMASKIVGWARSKIETLVPKMKIATLDGMYVDCTVQRAMVEEYLLQELKKRVEQPRKKLMGLRVLVPPSDKELTTYYYKRGFVDCPFPDTDEALLWQPKS